MRKKLRDIFSFFKDILPLLIPILIEAYFVAAIAGVNTIMISRLGTEEISAIGSVGAFLNMIAAFFIALSVGGTVLCAQFMGRGQRDRLNQMAALGISLSFFLSLAVSIIIFIFRGPIIQSLFGASDPLVLQYSKEYFNVVLFYYIPYAINLMAFGILRGAGDVKTPMKISIVMNLIHMFFTYVLMYGMDIRIGEFSLQTQSFGVRGSAISLLISQVSGLALVMMVLFRGRRAIRLNFATDFRFERRILGGIFKIGLPAGVEQIILNFGFLIIQTFIVTLSTVEIAANSIVNSVAFLICAPAQAIATITSTIIGRSVGEGETERARKELAMLQSIAIFAFAISCLIYVPGARFFVGLYSSDQAAIGIATPLVISYILCMTFTWAGSYQVPAGLRAAGDANVPSVISIGFIVLRVTLAYIALMILKLDLRALWVIAYIDVFLRALAYNLRRRGDAWLKGSLAE